MEKLVQTRLWLIVSEGCYRVITAAIQVMLSEHNLAQPQTGTPNKNPNQQQCSEPPDWGHLLRNQRLKANTDLSLTLILSGQGLKQQ